MPEKDDTSAELSSTITIEKEAEAEEPVESNVVENNRVMDSSITKQDSLIKPVAINQPAVKSNKQVKQETKTPVQTKKTEGNVVPFTAPLYGCLDLRTNPPWAKVYIDEIFIGETPRTGIIQLKTGTHRLVVVKTGFHKENLNISISSNDTLHKKIKMKPLRATNQ